MNDDDLLGHEVDAISLILSEFWANSNQNKSLDGDICSEETEWATIGDEEVDKRVNITFDKPTPEMTKHLESLYVKAQINGKTLAKVFVDGGASFSIMPLTMFRKIGKRQ